jgi:hypothetical protein
MGPRGHPQRLDGVDPERLDEDPTRAAAGGAQPRGGREPFRQVGQEDRGDERDPDPAAVEQAHPDGRRLGYAVEHRSQHQGQGQPGGGRCRDSGPGRVSPTMDRALAAMGAPVREFPVTQDKHQTPGDERERGDCRPALGDGLSGELEGHRADEHPGAEPHDQPDRPQRNLGDECGERSDEERETGKESPRGGGEHVSGPDQSGWSAVKWTPPNPARHAVTSRPTAADSSGELDRRPRTMRSASSGMS